MRIFYTILILLSISFSSFAQRDNTYLPSKRNFKIKYVSYDAKDRREYTEVWQLVGKSKQNRLIQYNIESEITTRKQNTFYQYFRLVSKDSVFYVGSERYLNPIELDSYQRMVIKISSDSVAIPIKPKIGQMLPEATCEASILRGTGSVLMSMNVLLVNRKVDAIENISTPAGTFNCYKISTDKITYSGIKKKKTKVYEWYSINVGLVRMEEYHSKGKLISYKVIESLAQDFFLP
ncbi:hypothetical protein L3049_01520 [Labilibaculum sp. DW002]|uniref:DUF3108 domain-containing protein n=1 Tax=Paralabilibaculum antarcticum TaxID=2912572 RepID=A0ABT5VQ95_9BACT|nr:MULTISPECIES: hypothetical protein [unclassified Labilibaculum]MBI9058698.1 hypothetical protein [Labilibaculum sp.]MDE5416668.1 hypothetical protein [Labilibaculum sp. DW002]